MADPLKGFLTERMAAGQCQRRYRMQIRAGQETVPQLAEKGPLKAPQQQ